MTFEKALKIVVIWGTYLEYCQSKLQLLFMSGIPESLLPFPKNILEEAINIVAEHHYNLGNKQEVEDLQRSIAYLLQYEDDEKAMINAANFFNKKEMREAVLSSFKEFQNKWIETQKL